MFRLLTTIGIIIASFGTAFAQADDTHVDEYNVPVAIVKCMQSKEVSDLRMSSRINPFFLRGNFDGDGKMDYVVWVTQQKTGKQGFAMCLTGWPNPVVISAGRFLGPRSPNDDDLKGYNAWKVDDKAPRLVPPDREGIMIIAKEQASALIYWGGKRYVWTQLGQ